MNYTEKKAYNEGVENALVVGTAASKYEIPEFRLTPHNMTELHAPCCGGNWQGKSYFDQYKEHFTNCNDVQITDDEIHSLVAHNHKNTTHSSLLFYIGTCDKYLCPHCGSTFDMEE